MAQKKDQNAEAKPKQARGAELQEKMKNSQAYGEDYRAEHEGADIKETAVQHPTHKNRSRK